MNKRATTSRGAGRRPTARLGRLVGGLIGKKCWRVDFGYGGALSLHFGRQIRYENSKMDGKRKGSWILDTCGTPWVLAATTEVVSSNDASEAELEAKVTALEGRTVVNLSILMPARILALTLSGKYSFLIVPTDADRRHELPYWELFTPGRQLIAFGPGKRWSCRASDVLAP